MTVRPPAAAPATSAPRESSSANALAAIPADLPASAGTHPANALAPGSVEDDDAAFAAAAEEDEAFAKKKKK